MKRRFKKETSGRYPEAVFATFHSFFYSILRTYAGYEKRVTEEEAVDFDDMLTACHTLLSDHPDVLAAVSSRFDHIQADEFQDVSPVQYEVMKLIAGKRCNLFIVGDDDQSVYAFRGADPDVMKRFVRTVPEVRVIRLNVNYRCRERILKLSTQLIKHNKHRFRKSFIAGRTDAPGEIALTFYPDVRTEAEHVLSAYKKACSAGKSCAIIVRTNEEAERFVKAGRALYQNAPNVLTMHAAKGLEFDTVFLPRLNEGVLPVRRSKESGRLEEERRLLYVGITRGRMSVFLSCVKAGGYDGVMSRFIKEMMPYLRKYAACAIFKSTFSNADRMRSEHTIEYI